MDRRDVRREDGGADREPAERLAGEEILVRRGVAAVADADAEERDPHQVDGDDDQVERGRAHEVHLSWHPRGAESRDSPPAAMRNEAPQLVGPPPFSIRGSCFAVFPEACVAVHCVLVGADTRVPISAGELG